MTPCTYFFEWAGFATQVAADAGDIINSRVFNFADRMMDGEHDILVWRAWYETPKGMRMFVADTGARAVTIWRTAVNRLAMLGLLATSQGLVLQWSEPPRDADGCLEVKGVAS